MKFSAIASVVAAAALCAVSASAADVFVGAELSSAYLSSGTTYNDGFVLGPSLEVSNMKYGETELPFILGFWGNIDLDDSFDPAYHSGRFSEIDLWAGLDIAKMIGNEDLTLYVGFLEYDYPNVGGETDYLVDAKVGYKFDYLNPTLRLKWNVGGGASGRCEMIARVGHDFDIGETGVSFGLSADIDYFRWEDGNAKDDGFASSLFAATLSWKDFYLTGGYVAQWDDKVLPDATEESSGYDVEWIGIFGWGHSF